MTDNDGSTMMLVGSCRVDAQKHTVDAWATNAEIRGLRTITHCCIRTLTSFQPIVHSRLNSRPRGKTSHGPWGSHTGRFIPSTVAYQRLIQ